MINTYRKTLADLSAAFSVDFPLHIQYAKQAVCFASQRGYHMSTTSMRSGLGLGLTDWLPLLGGYIPVAISIGRDSSSGEVLSFDLAFALLV